MGTAPLVELKDVAIGYSGRAILDRISFRLSQGDFLGIVGPNGAGKSTLLMTLLGNIRPVRGSLERRPGLRFGYVPQRSRLDPIFPLSVLDMVRLGGMGAGRFPLSSSPRRDAMAALEGIGLAHLASRSFFDLSGGQQQRVLVARALVRSPDVLVLDEPTAGMDLPSERSLLDFVTDLNRKRGTAVIVVAHAIVLVTGRAHRIALLNKDTGLFAVGTEAEIISTERLTDLYRSPIRVFDIEGEKVIRAASHGEGA